MTPASLLAGLVLTISLLAPVGHAHEAGHDAHGMHATASSWEGSVEGKAYSEFNHHVAGVFVLLIAASEAATVSGRAALLWMRFLLPVSMTLAGLLLLIFSDHDAWPIGTMTLAQTLSGADPEILQHKLYGILLLIVGAIESVRRSGRLGGFGWRVPLPLFAIVGGLMLLSHSHGAHPSAHKIALHHTVMGALAISAGSGKLVANGLSRPRWELAWPLLIFIIGIQLLFYSE